LDLARSSMATLAATRGRAHTQYTVVNGLTQAITVVKCKPSEVRNKVPTGDPKLEIRGTLKRSKVQRDKTEDMMALKDSRREISMREAISAFGNHSCASNM
jgi:hypothetical protein